MAVTPFLPRSVLFVITRGDSIGGAQIHVRDFSFHLREQGVAVHVALGSRGDLSTALESRGVVCHVIPGLVRSINPLSDFRAIWTLAKLIKRLKPALVSCHTAKAGMVGRIAAGLKAVPVVFTAHGWQFAEGIGSVQKLIVLAIELILGIFSRKIICVSDYDRSLALKFRLGPSCRFVTVHNGMPLLPAPLRTPPPSSPPGVLLAGKALVKTFKIIMIARFQDQKDHDGLIEALATLQDYSWVLEFVGDGPRIADVKALVHTHGLTERVAFLGQRLDVPVLLEQSDLFVLSSFWEGFPRSIIEAMRAALPVLCSDVGGCGESVQQGVTGFLVPPGDSRALAKSLEVFFCNPELAYSMGQAGRARYEDFFSFDAMFAHTARVWNRVLGAAL